MKFLSQGIFLLVSLLSVQNSIAGLPNIHLELPKGLTQPEQKNNKTYSLVAALDDQNPKRASLHQVYFLPRRNEVSLTGINWNGTVIDPSTGKRGGLCEGFDRSIDTLNKLESQIELSLDASKFGELQKNMFSRKLELETLVADYCGKYETLVDEEKAASKNQSYSRGYYDTDTQNIRKILSEKHEVESKCFSAQKELDFVTKNLEKFETQISKLVELENLLKKRREAVEFFGKVYGGNLTGLWSDGFEEAKQQLETLNSSIALVHLPERRLSIDVSGAHHVGELPAFLDYTLSGERSEMNSSQIPQSVTTITPSNQNSSLSSQNRSLSYVFGNMGTSASAGSFSTDLSVAGACGLLAQRQNQQPIAAFVITATSVFPSASVMRVKAVYNNSRIYERFKTLESKTDGFLGVDIRDSSETRERAPESEDFKFEFYSEDPMDPNVEREIRDQLKKELTARIVDSFSELKRDLKEIPVASRHKLMDISWTWMSDLFGTLNLGSLYQPSGTSTAETDFDSNWNKTVTEEWDVQRIVPVVNTASVVVKFPEDRQADSQK